MSPKKALEIIGKFLILSLESIGIGIAFGVISSLFFKWFRFLTHTAITESSVIYIIALCSYFGSESLELSGMISLLTCGVTQAHYTWYNLSPQGKTISSVSVSIFGAVAEGLVFAYIGLCLFTYMNEANPDMAKKMESNWSLSFIGFMAPVIVLGRLLSVYLADLLFRPCSSSKLSFKELTFISYGGMIRGAIAFGLVLKIPPDNEHEQLFPERDVLITTTLSLVIITTLFFGTFMNLAQKFLVSPKVLDKEDVFDG